MPVMIARLFDGRLRPESNADLDTPHRLMVLTRSASLVAGFSVVWSLEKPEPEPASDRSI